MICEMKSRTRVDDRKEESFWTAREMKQGYPLSPLLFNLLLADLEEVMGKMKWGREIRRGKDIYAMISYADDIVLLAENEDEMKSIRMKWRDWRIWRERI